MLCIKYALIGILVACLLACENDLERVAEFNPENFIDKELTKDVELIYSDSAIIRTIIRAPKMINYTEAGNKRQEFPEGIEVKFFDEGQQVNSTLTANFAVRHEKKREIVVQNNVVWRSTKPETLETEELIWNEVDGKVVSNRYVKVTTPKDIFYGYGLEANEDFTWWKINVPEGRMDVQATE